MYAITLKASIEAKFLTPVLDTYQSLYLHQFTLMRMFRCEASFFTWYASMPIPRDFLVKRQTRFINKFHFSCVLPKNDPIVTWNAHSEYTLFIKTTMNESSWDIFVLFWTLETLVSAKNRVDRVTTNTILPCSRVKLSKRFYNYLP